MSKSKKTIKNIRRKPFNSKNKSKSYKVSHREYERKARSPKTIIKNFKTNALEYFEHIGELTKYVTYAKIALHDADLCNNSSDEERNAYEKQLDSLLNSYKQYVNVLVKASADLPDDGEKEVLASAICSIASYTEIRFTPVNIAFALQNTIESIRKAVLNKIKLPELEVVSFPDIETLLSNDSTETEALPELSEEAFVTDDAQTIEVLSPEEKNDTSQNPETTSTC